jgi:hypothetical protein
VDRTRSLDAHFDAAESALLFAPELVGGEVPHERVVVDESDLVLVPGLEPVEEVDLEDVCGRFCRCEGRTSR